MGYPLNPQQTKAVSDFEADLLVTAGAGTGKTTVLTSKYLRLLEERRATIGEIVAITFTKKAAAEMRERIRDEIRARVKTAETLADAAFWKDNLFLLENARIGTFHSFCLGLIREHPLEAGIAPVTGVLGEGETAIFTGEAIETMVTGYMKAPDTTVPDKQILLEILLDFGWEGFQRDLREVYRTIREGGIPFPEVVRHGIRGLETACANCPFTVDQIIAEMEALLDFSRTAPLTERAGEVLASLREEWPAYRDDLTGADRLNESLPALAGLIKVLPKNMPNTIKERVVHIRDMIDAVFIRLLDEEVLRRFPVFGDMLIRLDAIYSRTKRELGYLDFSDQLSLARDLLRNYPAIAAEVRAGIRYLLVDEFQDTNSLQMDLITLLLGEGYQGGRLMVVGDIKQSIYRFRGAEADLMLQLESGLQARQGHLIPLTHNYRSAPQVIGFVNAISGSVFRDEPFPYEPLVAASAGSPGDIEFILSGDPTGRATEARMIARRIRQLVEPAPESEMPEQVAYGDIAILFRVKTAIPVYQKALQELGIPYYTASGGDFYQCPEVRDQLNLLRITLNRYDGVALLGLLTSPYAGVSDESLLWLAGGGDLVTAFYSHDHFAPEINIDERQRLIRFRKLLNLLSEQREYLGIPGIIRIALDYCHYRETLWAFPDAGQRLANLEKLLVKADEFIAKGFHDLRRFLAYIEELEEVEVMEGEAPTQLETGNVVRLMTVHRAKGLEFPVVFLPDLDRRFKRGITGRMAYHKAVGYGFGVKYGENETGYGTAWEEIKKLNRHEELAELKRILYVALTRAKQRLILVGSGRSKSKATNIGNADSWMKWFELLLPLSSAGPVLDFEGIPIRIIRELPELAKVSGAGGLSEDDIAGFWEAAAAAEAETAVNIEPEAAVPFSIPFQSRATFKVTELLVFKECPRLYFWKYRLGLEDTSERSMTVHDENFRDGAGATPNGPDLGLRIGKFIHQVARLTGPEWPEELWTGGFSDLREGTRERLKDDLLRMWGNFRNSPFTEKAGELWDEVPFTVKLTENVLAEGRFDRLIRDKNGRLILVDYKTHRIPTGEIPGVAAGYFWQLQLYALAVKALWGRLPDQAVLYFVYSDRQVEVPLEPGLLEKTKREVIEMAEFSGKHNRLEDYEKRRKCDRCGYWEYCREEGEL
jgi:ATP-dependent helicase/nuclease subunit A